MAGGERLKKVRRAKLQEQMKDDRLNPLGSGDESRSGDMNLGARMGERASRKEERRQSDRRYLSG